MSVSQKRPRWRLSFSLESIVTVLGGVFTAAIAKMLLEGELPRHGIGAITIPLVGLVLAFLSLLIRLRKAKPPTAATTITDRFANIHTTVTQMQAAVNQEAAAIQQAVLAVQKQMRDQEDELRALGERLAAERAELDKYAPLMSMTKGQQEAFVQLVNRDKRRDQILSFVSGVVSSAVVAIIFLYISILMTPKPNHVPVQPPATQDTTTASPQ
jgi:hypothetical protein